MSFVKNSREVSKAWPIVLTRNLPAEDGELQWEEPNVSVGTYVTTADIHRYCTCNIIYGTTNGTLPQTENTHPYAPSQHAFIVE